MVKTVAEIIGGFIEDKSSKVLSSLDSFEGFLFDSPDIVSQKVHFAMQQGLGGLFLWEIGQDHRSELYPGGMLLQSAFLSVISASGEDRFEL